MSGVLWRPELAPPDTVATVRLVIGSQQHTILLCRTGILSGHRWTVTTHAQAFMCFGCVCGRSEGTIAHRTRRRRWPLPGVRDHGGLSACAAAGVGALLRRRTLPQYGGGRVKTAGSAASVLSVSRGHRRARSLRSRVLWSVVTKECPKNRHQAAANVLEKYFDLRNVLVEGDACALAAQRASRRRASTYPDGKLSCGGFCGYRSSVGFCS